MEIKKYFFAAVIFYVFCFSTTFACSSSATSSSIPIFTAWKKCNGTNLGITTNVQNVKYSQDYVYTYAASIPDYTIGPWSGNPNTPSDQMITLKFPRTPTKSSTQTTVSTGHVGQLINGVLIYNSMDAQSYNNMGIWNRNAYYWEGSSFDSCLGHPDPSGTYHHHVFPKCIYSNLNSSSHSPILGFVFDGYPIYGPYAYSSPNNTNSTITRMRTSFRLRSITARQTLPSGTVLSSSQYGPAISSSYPLGAYLEDYEYVSGYGDLDVSNGRWCITPDYPNGTYAYFTTLDSSGNPEYPFILGTYYYGKVETSDLGSGKVVILEGVNTYYTCAGYKYYLSSILLIVSLLIYCLFF